MKERLIILDFGSQFTQLIARRLRELNIYCEIFPYNKIPNNLSDVKAFVLSGSPFSVLEEDALVLDLKPILGKYPILAICYGAQLIAHQLGGKVLRSEKREFGKAMLQISNRGNDLFRSLNPQSQVWMSHGDSIENVPEGFEIIASTSDIPVAAYRSTEGHFKKEVYCLQFHPEVTHTLEGRDILHNFVFNVADMMGDWTPSKFIEETIAQLKSTIGNSKVLMGLSGGVDSTVAATLIHRAIGKNLYCVFLDNGLLRKNEFEDVLHSYQDMGLNILGVDASDEFLFQLEGVTDPELKRKAIGRVFIEVFEKEALKIKDVDFLGQGTIYPDVIESVSVHGPSVTIKSHHNVGGLPDKLKLKIVEPLRMLFKDEVRKVGKALNIPQQLIGRHPFPLTRARYKSAG